jgi:metallo-beta-lactamase class B
VRRLALVLTAVLPLVAPSHAEQGKPARSSPTSTAAAGQALTPDPPMNCSACAEWNLPRAPFKVFGNTYFVGTQGLSAVAIDTGDGLILIDVALPQSAPLIDANLRQLGLDTRTIKYIAVSHGHYDHVGGVRSMQRYTGATVLASPSTAQALRLGHPVPGDPQFGTTPGDSFPAVTENVRALEHLGTVRLGNTVLTAQHTPGHTPGATTWTWQSCEGPRCLNMVYVDSLTAVSNDAFKYTAVPGLVDRYRATMKTVAALPCDIVISTHPSATGLDEKVAARAKGKIAPGAAGDPMIDAGACKALAERSLKALEERVAKEKKDK